MRAVLCAVVVVFAGCNNSAPVTPSLDERFAKVYDTIELVNKLQQAEHKRFFDLQMKVAGLEGKLESDEKAIDRLMTRIKALEDSNRTLADMLVRMLPSKTP